MRITLKREKGMHPILITILFVLCLIGPEFKIFPRYTWLLSGIGLCTFFDEKFAKYIGALSKVNIFYYLYIGACVFFTLVPPLINQTSDFSYITIVLGILLTSLRGLLLIYVLYKVDKERIYDNFVEFFLNACCVCVVFTLIFIVFPNFKEYWCNEVLINVSKFDYSYYEFRYSINGFAGFSMASIFAVASVISGYLLAKDEVKNHWHIVKFVFSIIGCFFYGRVAIVGIILAFIIIIAQRSSGTKTLKIVMKLALLALIMIILLNYLASIDDKFYQWREWAFSFIGDLLFEGKITDYSVTHLFGDMYWLPEIKTLLFGDGYYTDPITNKYYMSTDSGIMRVILFSGVGGIILFWGMLVFVFQRLYIYANGKLEKRLIIALTLLWLVLEIKGESYQRILMLMYPIFLCFLSRRRRMRNNE